MQFHRYKNLLREILKWSGFFLATLTVIFTVTEYYGFWDDVRCTNQLREVAQNMNTSYKNVQRIFTPQDSEWVCLFGLIENYSFEKLPDDRPAMFIGRWQAMDSVKQEIGPNQVFEWTVPTTPLLVGFKASTDGKYTPEDIMFVGSIGDLVDWVERDKADFSFKVQNIFLGLLSLAVALLLLLAEPRFDKPKQPQTDSNNI